MQSQLVTASILEVGWLASGCVPALKKKLDGGGSQKVLVITESIRRLVIEVHRIVAPALALSSSEHIVRREAKSATSYGGMDVFIYGRLLFVRPYH